VDWLHDALPSAVFLSPICKASASDFPCSDTNLVLDSRPYEEDNPRYRQQKWASDSHKATLDHKLRF
jgi:hypothetical protein